MTVFLPTPGQALVDPRTGHFTSTYRRWANALTEAVNAAQGGTIIVPPDPVSFVVSGAGSVTADGSVAGGEFVVTLVGDKDNPPPNSFYGATTAGDKGFVPVYDALVEGQGIAIRDSGYIVIDTVETPADLPLTGNSGEAVRVTGAEPGLYAWDGTAFTIDTAADGAVTVTCDATAAEIPYDNTASALSATDVQAAIDELATTGGGEVISQWIKTKTSTPDSTTLSIPTDDTIPQNTEGAAYAALDTTITPTSATSTLDIEVYLPYVSGSTTQQVVAALFRDSGADAISASFVTIEAANRLRSLTIRATVASGSTAATTFKLRYGTNAGTGYILQSGAASRYFGGVGVASMTVREIL